MNRKTLMSVPFAFVVAAIALLALPTNAHAASGTGASQSAQLPITPVDWMPIAIAGVLIISAVAALVYMLSGLIGSTNARAWSRMQVYEALVSVVLILAFGFFSYLFFLNPQAAYGSINLVPQTCGLQGAHPATNIFELATCDISTFNAASFTMAGYLYYASFASGLIPGVSVSIAPIPSQAGIGVKFEAPLNPIPVSTDTLFKIGFDAFLFMMVLNQLQMLLISGSLLFLSLFLTLGLIVRTFGVTRSFGGAMIAFGLGLGLVYPMLVSLTYGFVVTSSGLACVAVPTLTCAGGLVTTSSQIIQSIISFGTAGLSGEFGSFVLTIGYIIAGATFIPFLNFTVLNAFIVDFSKAVGEQMDFMSLLGQFI